MNSMRKYWLILVIFILTLFFGSCKSYTYYDASLRIPPTRSTIPTSVTATVSKQTIATQDTEKTIQEPKSVETIAESTLDAESVTEPEPFVIETTEMETVAESNVPAKEALEFPYIFNKGSAVPIAEKGPVSITAMLINASHLEAEDMSLIIDQTEPLIQQSGAHIVTITGVSQDLIDRLLESGSQGVAFGTSVVLTCLPIASIDKHSLTLEPALESLIQFAVADLEQEYSIVQLLLENQLSIDQWSKTVQDYRDERMQSLQSVINELHGEQAIIALSAGEPSHVDWKIDDSYRSEFDWPLSFLLEFSSFIDNYDVSRHSPEQEPGTTLSVIFNELLIEERLDFFYSRNLIPESSRTISLPVFSHTENGQPIQRAAVVSTWIIP